MAFRSIASRELRLTVRKSRTYWMRSLVAGFAAMTVVGMASESIRGLQPTTVVGAQLFPVVSVVGVAVCLLAGVFITADAISSERRDRTLELLTLTRLNGFDLVSGKMLALALNPLFCVCAALPMLALPVVWGGVTAGEFWRMALVWVNSFLFSLALGLFVSALSWRALHALSLAVLFILVFTIGPLIVAVGQNGKIDNFWASISPGTGAVAALAKSYTREPAVYWSNLAATQALIWVLLWIGGLYAFRLPTEEPKTQTTWSGRFEAWRRKFARKPISDNPVQTWETELWKQGIAVWGFLILAGAVWLLCFRYYRRLWLNAELVFGATAFLHLVLKGWLAVEASRRFSDARRMGELELLLVTPITVDDIIIGRIRSLKRQFLLPIVLVLSVDITLLLFGMKTAGWWGNAGIWALGFLVNAGLFVTDCYTLVWVGLWQGLAARNSLQAFLRSVALVIALPWVAFVVTIALLGVAFEPGTWAIGWWFAVGICNCFILCDWASRRLDSNFRSAASAVPT
jgi:ABC-type transport system involved in multi-copper enzyme maturation permease subunit